VPTARRETLWVDTLFDETIASGGKAEQTLMPIGIPDLRYSGVTLLRTILCHDYSYAVHDSGEGTQILDVGIAVSSQEAFNAAALPDPEVRSDHPQRGWVYRCRHRLIGYAADQAAADVRSVYRDLRGKRKLYNGQLYVSFTNTAGTGVASSLSVVGIIRSLLLLS